MVRTDYSKFTLHTQEHKEDIIRLAASSHPQKKNVWLYSVKGVGLNTKCHLRTGAPSLNRLWSVWSMSGQTAVIFHNCACSVCEKGLGVLSRDCPKLPSRTPETSLEMETGGCNIRVIIAGAPMAFHRTR